MQLIVRAGLTLLGIGLVIGLGVYIHPTADRSFIGGPGT